MLENLDIKKSLIVWSVFAVVSVVIIVIFLVKANPSDKEPYIPTVKVMDAIVVEQGVDVLIHNPLDKTIHNFKVKMAECDVESDPVTLPPDKTIKVTIACDIDKSVKSKYTSEFYVNYDIIHEDLNYLLNETSWGTIQYVED